MSSENSWFFPCVPQCFTSLKKVKRAWQQAERRRRLSTSWWNAWRHEPPTYTNVLQTRLTQHPLSSMHSRSCPPLRSLPLCLLLPSTTSLRSCDSTTLESRLSASRPLGTYARCEVRGARALTRERVASGTRPRRAMETRLSIFVWAIAETPRFGAAEISDIIIDAVATQMVSDVNVRCSFGVTSELP